MVKLFVTNYFQGCSFFQIAYLLFGFERVLTSCKQHMRKMGYFSFFDAHSWRVGSRLMSRLFQRGVHPSSHWYQRAIKLFCLFIRLLQSSCQLLLLNYFYFFVIIFKILTFLNLLYFRKINAAISVQPEV